MQTPLKVLQHDVCRPLLKVGEEGPVLLSGSQVSPRCSGKDCVTQVVLAGDALSLTPTTDAVVAIPVTLETNGYAEAPCHENRHAQPVEDGHPELDPTHMQAQGRTRHLIQPVATLGETERGKPGLVGDIRYSLSQVCMEDIVNSSAQFFWDTMLNCSTTSGSSN